MKIYTPKGKELPQRKGQMVPAGSYILRGEKWETTTRKKVIHITPRRWDNLTQSHVGGEVEFRERMEQAAE